MAKARTEKLIIGGTEYTLRWDMNAIATVEEITGENSFLGLHINMRNVRAVIWAAIDAAAAAQDKEAPISLRKLGSHFEEEEDYARAVRVMKRLIGDNSPPATADQEGGNPQAAAAVETSSPSSAATSSDATTSDSANGNSGS